MDDFQLKITPYQIEELLKKAIKKEKIELVFQPKIEISSERICGVEVFCRWYEVEHGFIPPKDFIPLAEETGLIIELTEWILRKACEQNFQWQVKTHQQFPISVKISSKQLQNSNFIATIQTILKDSNLAPSFLDLEIVESSDLTNQVIENMQAITHLGVSFSLDNFGTGTSSLSQLFNLPLKALKIDKDIINKMVIHQREATIARAIIQLAKTSDLISVAGGVETEKQLALLRSYQCDQMQGYLFSRPLPAERLTDLLTTHPLLASL